MDAANTLQIPRAVVSAADEQDSETTMVVPAVRSGPPTEEIPAIPAIAQEAMTDVVGVPHPGPRSRQRRLEQHQSMLAAQAARQAEDVDGLVPTMKQPPAGGSLSQRLDG
jgi:hypothetical protein